MARKGNLQLYADDSSINFIVNDLSTIEKMIKDDIEKISNWFKNNLLVLNAEKKKIIFFNDQRNLSIPDFYLNNHNIEKIDKIKFFGLHINSKLNWNSHVEYIYI